VATPLFRLGGHNTVGDNRWQSETSSRGESLVAAPARSQLGVEVRGTAESESLLQKGDVTREKDEPVSVSGKKSGQADRRNGGRINECTSTPARPSTRPPVYRSNRSA
jgi:hypothetical protein